MINNDVLRRLRYTFNFSDSTMMRLASSEGKKVTRAQVSDWLKKDDDPSQQKCDDVQLAIFLNNLIDDKRGKREGGQPPLEKRLSNNLIFMKLKIALKLQAEDVIEILALANFKLSKHELSAFFRKPGHKHYRECKDQILRNFLQGLQFKFRPVDEKSKVSKVTKVSKVNNTKPKKELADKKLKPKDSSESTKPTENTYKWKKLKPSS
ncbi:MAG TPA: DUF1456 family protein [Leucothrix sp.]|nr:DUF1456 family protein [Leucothrix sp.]